MVLDEEKFVVVSITSEELETYFLNLTGGNQNA